PSTWVTVARAVAGPRTGVTLARGTRAVVPRWLGAGRHVIGVGDGGLGAGLVIARERLLVIPISGRAVLSRIAERLGACVAGERFDAGRVERGVDLGDPLDAIGEALAIGEHIGEPALARALTRAVHAGEAAHAVAFGRAHDDGAGVVALVM